VVSIFDVKRRAEEFVALFFEHPTDHRALTERGQAGEFFGSNIDGPPVQAL